MLSLDSAGRDAIRRAHRHAKTSIYWAFRNRNSPSLVIVTHLDYLLVNWRIWGPDSWTCLTDRTGGGERIFQHSRVGLIWPRLIYFIICIVLVEP